jgi:hypothetical protein
MTAVPAVCLDDMNAEVEAKDGSVEIWRVEWGNRTMS